MKAARGTIGRAVDQPDPRIRFYLFYGADESQSRAFAERLRKGLAAEKFVVSGSAVRGDPALLADEAGAMSLFGGRRAIWIEPATDEIAPGVGGLLSAPAAESPVVAIAGALRKTSALVKAAEAHPLALAHVSYAPEGKDAERMVMDLGRTWGLRIAAPVAARIAETSGNDQAIVGQELAKLALFVGAAPESPKELDHDALDAVGADVPEGNFLGLADLALAGDLGQLSDGLAGLASGGSEAVPALRALQRRLLMLAPLRARVEAGERPDGVMASAGKALFWKDKDLVGKLIARWDAAGLAKVAERAGQLERELMREVGRSGARQPEAAALGQELLAVARHAQRRRA